MARPSTRGAGGQWSLTQVAAEAGVSRGVARAAVARGYLPGAGLTETDIVLLRVAAACLAYPDPTAPLPPKGSPAASRPGRRDADVLRYTRAILGDPRAEPGAAVLLAGKEVAAADRSEDLLDTMRRLPPHAVLVLPVGLWAGLLPSARAARARARAQAHNAAVQVALPTGPRPVSPARAAVQEAIAAARAGSSPDAPPAAPEPGDLLELADQIGPAPAHPSGEPW